MDEEIEDEDLDAELSKNDVASTPNDAADPVGVVNARFPKDILEKYEIYSYRSAAVILSESHEEEFNELITALRNFTITKAIIRTAGGNESDVPKLLSKTLRPLGWHETAIKGDLLVKAFWKEQVKNAKGKLISETKQRELVRPNFIDGHKVDYVKGKVAFDLEWNSKDQTFDRDLYAFNAFALCGIIDVGILLTRSKDLNQVFKKMGPALKKDGSIDIKKSGVPKTILEKYGASTTWMGKLLYRLNAGRNGSCPVLAIGIKPSCISDLESNDHE